MTMRSYLTNKLRRFSADRRGTAAIEFAFVAPAMLAGLLVMTDLAKMVVDRTNMQAAARAGAQYMMNGGRDLEQARNIVTVAWSAKPQDGEVVAEHYCMCGNAVHACNALCTDQSIPESYGRVRLAGTLVGLWSDFEQRTDETVRVR
jgi:Flp pilus assembly protein TadG